MIWVRAFIKIFACIVSLPISNIVVENICLLYIAKNLPDEVSFVR